MARRKRTRPGSAYDRGVRVQTTISPKASKMIDALLATGLFGLNRALVVQELIYRSLRADDVQTFIPLIPLVEYPHGREMPTLGELQPAVRSRGRRG